MPREFKRADRVSDAIQRSLARIIQSEVRDPRLGMVNINAVSVSQDLTVAKVYVTFVGQDSEAEDKKKVDVLNNASSFIRSLMAKDVKMRIVPRLQFIYDASVVRGQQMTDLIDKALSADRVNPSDEEE